MSRQEDFDRQADDYSNCCFEEDDSLFTVFHFKEGAEYGYQYAIPEVCHIIRMIYIQNGNKLPSDFEDIVNDKIKTL